MENMDKELTLPKWVLINIPHASKYFSPKCLPKPKSFKFLKKNSLWASVVRVHVHCIIIKHCRPWVKMLLIYNNGSIYCSRTYFIFCCKITAFFLQVFFFYRNLFLFSSVLYIKMHYIISFT